MQKILPGQQVIDGPLPDGVRMSEVLRDFIEPYEPFAETKDAFEKLVTVGVVAWNVMLFPEDDRQRHLDELLGIFSEDIRDDGRRIIKEMMERKERFFPQNRRMILGFEVADTGTDWHVTVMSTASPV